MTHLSDLETALGRTFCDQRLLRNALLHRSFVNERPQEADGLPANERLEFLGDAVLNYLSADLLYRRFPTRTEGELTTLRTTLVKTSTLAGFARTLRLGQYIQLSMGDDSASARQRPALLADLFEAILGAIYLDGGIQAAQTFVTPFLEHALSQGTTPDYKTTLQERVQARDGKTPYYRTVAVSGPDHRRVYTVEVVLQEQRLGIGSGQSKQAAAQQAAFHALEHLGEL